MLDARPVSGGPSRDASGKRSGARISAGGSAPAASNRDPVEAEAVLNAGSPRYRTNGRLFYRMGGESWVCSATVIQSKRRNVVMTAGHCLFDNIEKDQPKEWAEDAVFVPGYSPETAPDGPFGQFPASGMSAPKGWVEKGLYNYDMGMVALDRPVERETGARKIDFDADLTRRGLEILGYPVAPDPLDGKQLVRCIPASVGFDWARSSGPIPFEARTCALRQGASGGGWIAGRFLVSVISYGYCDSGSPPKCGPGIYGPRLGSAAINIYRSEAIGGSKPPAVKLIKRPRAKSRKRAMNLRAGGDGTTPLRYRVKLDRNKPVFTGPVIKIRKLSVGRHVIRIRSVDQTGRLSKRTITRKFRVLPRKKKRNNRS